MIRLLAFALRAALMAFVASVLPSPLAPKSWTLEKQPELYCSY